MTTTQSRYRPGLQLSLIFAAIILIFAAIILTAYFAFRKGSELLIHAVMVGNTGPVTAREDWPKPLDELTHDADDAGITVDESTVHVHCLCQGMDPEYVWRMDATPGLLEHLFERWQLTRDDKPEWSILGGRSWLSGEPTPPWWSPKRDQETSFYVCPQTLAGEKGDRFQVAFDKKRNVVFVHYWDNF